MSKNNARTAVAAATKAAAKPATTATVNENAKFLNKLCKVIGGRKMVGDTVKVFRITKGSAYKKPSALCEGGEALKRDETPIFMNPAYLEIVGDMTAEDIKRLDTMQKEQQEETLYIAAYAKTENDKTICLSYPTWARDLWFAKPTMISLTGAQTPEGSKIFEIAAWKVKKECGLDSYNALVAKQSDLEALVNKA